MSEGLKNKMYNYEVAPPAKLWDHIATALDESELTHEFPSTLYGIEITAPVAVWEKIKTSLDAEQETAIPKHRKFSPYFRYAAAAAIIGLIAFGSLQLLKKQSGKKEIAKGQVIVPVKDSPASGINEPAATDEARNEAALKASEQTIAKLDMPARNRKKAIADNYFSDPDYPAGTGIRTGSEDSSPELHDEEKVTSPIAHQDIQSVKSDNTSRYIMLMTPDGNIIRMSKKLVDLVCCVSGQEQDENCKSQLKVWREKMAKSSVAPSPGNFMDILNLVNTLQDNNN